MYINYRNISMLMTCLYADLGSASDWLKFQPIRITTKIWVETRHKYGISAPVTQTSFCEGSSGDLVKRWLFSKANITLVDNILCIRRLCASYEWFQDRYPWQLNNVESGGQ